MDRFGCGAGIKTILLGKKKNGASNEDEDEGSYDMAPRPRSTDGGKGADRSNGNGAAAGGRKGPKRWHSYKEPNAEVVAVEDSGSVRALRRRSNSLTALSQAELHGFQKCVNFEDHSYQVDLPAAAAEEATAKTVLHKRHIYGDDDGESIRSSKSKTSEKTSKSWGGSGRTSRNEGGTSHRSHRTNDGGGTSRSGRTEGGGTHRTSGSSRSRSRGGGHRTPRARSSGRETTASAEKARERSRSRTRRNANPIVSPNAATTPSPELGTAVARDGLAKPSAGGPVVKPNLYKREKVVEDERGESDDAQPTEAGKQREQQRPPQPVAYDRRNSRQAPAVVDGVEASEDESDEDSSNDGRLSPVSALLAQTYREKTADLDSSEDDGNSNSNTFHTANSRSRSQLTSVENSLETSFTSAHNSPPSPAPPYATKTKRGSKNTMPLGPAVQETRKLAPSEPADAAYAAGWGEGRSPSGHSARSPSGVSTRSPSGTSGQSKQATPENGSSRRTSGETAGTGGSREGLPGLLIGATRSVDLDERADGHAADLLSRSSFEAGPRRGGSGKALLSSPDSARGAVPRPILKERPNLSPPEPSTPRSPEDGPKSPMSRAWSGMRLFGKKKDSKRDVLDGAGEPESLSSGMASPRGVNFSPPAHGGTHPQARTSPEWA